MTRTPLERLDREIQLYIALIDARRARAAETIDHEAHLQLLYIQRAAMSSRAAWPTADDLDDATALLGTQPPPVLDVAAELHRELEGHARPLLVPAGVGGFGRRDELLTDRELEPIRNAVSRHRMTRWQRLRRLGRRLRAMLTAPASEDPVRTYQRGGLGYFL